MGDLAAGLHELELPFRATLELRYRRGLPDETIAAVAGFDENEVQRQRSRALVWLAQRTGTRGPKAIDVVEEGLAALSPAAWAGESEPGAVLPPEPEPEPDPEPDLAIEPPPAAAPPPVVPPAPAEDGETHRLPVSQPPPSSARSTPAPQPKPFPSPATKKARELPADTRRKAIGLLALIAAAIALFIVLTGDPADEGAPPPTVTNPNASANDKGPDSPPPGGGGEGEQVAMEPVPGADIEGGIDVSLSGSEPQPEIEIQLDGLPAPDGEYRGWLYGSVIESRTLGRARSGDGLVAATLPENWHDYTFIDLSIQEPGSIAHSGRSVARIAIEDLPAP